MCVDSEHRGVSSKGENTRPRTSGIRVRAAVLTEGSGRSSAADGIDASPETTGNGTSRAAMNNEHVCHYIVQVQYTIRVVIIPKPQNDHPLLYHSGYVVYHPPHTQYHPGR